MDFVNFLIGFSIFGGFGFGIVLGLYVAWRDHKAEKDHKE